MFLPYRSQVNIMYDCQSLGSLGIKVSTWQVSRYLVAVVVSIMENCAYLSEVLRITRSVFEAKERREALCSL